jgi:hypothetical protein
MAKTKNQGSQGVKNGKKMNGTPQKKGKNVKSRSNPLQKELGVVAQHLLDPCRSPLTESGLPGQKGMISRFATVESVSVTGDHNYWLVINPGFLSYDSGISANVGATFTPSTMSKDGPGKNFLTTGPGLTYRTLGFCLEVMNTTPQLDRGGMWNALHAPADVFYLNETSGANLIASANEGGTFGGETSVMIKWRPGYMDDTYADYKGVDDSWDLNDRNSIVLNVLAPSSIQTLSVKMTAIVEWVPKIGTTFNGMVTPLTGGSTHNLKSAQVASMLDKTHGDWWYERRDQLIGMGVEALGGLLKRFI